MNNFEPRPCRHCGGFCGDSGPTCDERYDAAWSGEKTVKNNQAAQTMPELRELAQRTIPFLRDEGSNYEDDGNNEPLELARAIEAALAGNPNRDAANPGSCECEKCGRVFIGAEWHVLCGICVDHGVAQPDGSGLRNGDNVPASTPEASPQPQVANPAYTAMLDDAANMIENLRNGDDAYYTPEKIDAMQASLRSAALSQTAGVVLARGWFHSLPDEDDYEFHDDASGAGNNCDGCIRAMIVAAPAASGGERVPLSERLYRGPAHDPSDRERGTEPQATSESIPSAAASVSGDHPDALQDGTLSKSTAKRVGALAGASERTIRKMALADPDPYKASKSPLLNNPEWGVQLNPPSAASVSERARDMVTALYGDKAVFTRHDVARALEQALTQQRGSQLGDFQVAWDAVCEALNLVCPEWTNNGQTGLQSAVITIQKLAAATPQPSADAVRELVKRWRTGAGLCTRQDYGDGARDALNECADELESLLSAASGEKGVG
jgi:hypothetical protein